MELGLFGTNGVVLGVFCRFDVVVEIKNQMVGADCLWSTALVSVAVRSQIAQALEVVEHTLRTGHKEHIPMNSSAQISQDRTRNYVYSPILGKNLYFVSLREQPWS